VARPSGRRIAGVTVALRPLAADDAAWCDTWLPSLAKSVGCSAGHSAAELLDWARRRTGGRVATIGIDGALAGVAAWHPIDGDARAWIIELVALPAGASRHGTGMKAALAIEQELRARRASRLYAPVPGRHGIAVYFWIRLGYHPLLRPAWPEQRHGFGWMSRDLA